MMYFRVIKLTSDLNQLHIVINLLLMAFIKEICTLPPNISTIFLFKITHLLDSCSLHHDLDVLYCYVMLMFMVCGVTIMSTCVLMFHTKLFTAKQCDMMMAMLSQYTNVSHVRFT